MSRKQTVKEFFKLLQLIYFALLGSQAIFLTVLVVTGFGLTQVSGGFPAHTIYVFYLVAGVAVVNAIIVGNVLWNKKIASIKADETVENKMELYRSATIIKLVMLEGGFYFVLVSFLITRDIVFAVISAIIIIYFLTLKPTKEKAVSQLPLNPSEKMLLSNENSVIAFYESDK